MVNYKVRSKRIWLKIKMCCFFFVLCFISSYLCALIQRANRYSCTDIHTWMKSNLIFHLERPASAHRWCAFTENLIDFQSINFEQISFSFLFVVVIGCFLFWWRLSTRIFANRTKQSFRERFLILCIIKPYRIDFGRFYFSIFVCNPTIENSIFFFSNDFLLLLF